MSKINLFFCVMFLAGSADAARSSRIKTTEVPEEQKNYALELQGGGIRPLNGPEDGNAMKLSLGLRRNLNSDWNIGPKISYLSIHESGGPAVSVKYTSWDGSFWANYRFAHFWHIDTYAGLGIGARQDLIQTRLLGETEKSKSEFYSVLSSALGLTLAPVKNSGFFFSLELQLAYAVAYQNREGGISAGLGFRF